MRVPAFGTLPPGKNSLAAAGERANTSLRKPHIDAFLLLYIPPSRASRIAGARDCASGSRTYFFARCTRTAGAPGMTAASGPITPRSRLGHADEGRAGYAGGRNGKSR